MTQSVTTISVGSRLIAAMRPDLFVRDFATAVAMIWRYRRLTLAMAMRELKVRYAGQIAGSLWIVGHPLFQLLLFVFIFGVVFKQKIGGTAELPRGYTTYILSGLIPWLTMSPVFNTCCQSITANANLVTQFTFETELLPVKDVLIAMVFWVVGIATLMIYCLAVEGSLPLTYLLMPFVLVMHLMLMIGIGWMLASLSVFLRDIKDFAIILTTAGVYVLPIVYLPAWVPSIFRPFLLLNPLSAVIWVYQDVLYFGRIEHPNAWYAFFALSTLAFVVGHRLFQRLKPYFGSAL